MILAEIGLVAVFVALGLFTRTGDIHLRCFQVDSETRMESRIGDITLHRKKRRVTAVFSEWGPQRLTIKSDLVVALPDERLPLSIAIYDTEEGVDGHAFVLFRSNGMKKRFVLSDQVADESRLDYCVKIKRR